MTDKTIHIITGGQRSGKSNFGERAALALDSTPTYLATSKHWDEEHSERIKKHIQQRSDVWTTIEEELYISKVVPANRAVLLDCITLWLTNVMDHFKYDTQKSFEFIQSEWKALCDNVEVLVVVTNEIGLGVIPMESSTRKFVDLHGLVNQLIVESATKVDLVVAGYPVSVK